MGRNNDDFHAVLSGVVVPDAHLEKSAQEWSRKEKLAKRVNLEGPMKDIPVAVKGNTVSRPTKKAVAKAKRKTSNNIVMGE